MTPACSCCPSGGNAAVRLTRSHAHRATTLSGRLQRELEGAALLPLELAALKRSPERLDRLGDLRVGEADHRHPRNLGSRIRAATHPAAGAVGGAHASIAATARPTG